MKNDKEEILAAIACVLMGIIALITFAVFAFSTGNAEVLPPPDAALTGDLRPSEAPMGLYVAECLRVDVVSVSADGAWAELKLPYVPPSIWGVVLFDGWHVMYGDWEQADDTTLRLHFWPDDLERLDGTVGLYLMILAE